MGSPGRLDGAADLPAEELALATVALVGRYALQLGFASGHDTGLYTFRLLRRLPSAA